MTPPENQPATRGKRPPYNPPVVDRALSLLGAFSERHPAMSLSELARVAGMPVTTAMRLASRLVAWGALERLESGDYVIGVRLWEVASLAPRGHGLRTVALPLMEDLYEVTRNHVLLAVRDGREAVLIERLSAKDAPPAMYRAGGRLPLRSTAVGLVLLAAASQQFQDAYLAQPPQQEPGMVHFTPEQLVRRLIDVRRTGFATIRRSYPSRTVSVAAPVLNVERRTVGALSVLVPDGSSSPQVLVPVVRATARAISRNLGYRHDTFEGGRLRPGGG